MSAQNLLLLHELDGSGNRTNRTRPVQSGDDITIRANSSIFTNLATFSAGLALAASMAITGAGAMEVKTTTGDLTLRSTDGNVITKLGDASGVKKHSVRDSSGSEMFYVDSDGNVVINGNLTVSGTATLQGATLAHTGSIETTGDNLLLVNAGPGTASRDGGLLVQRYQPDNDTGAGDVVGDTALVSATLQTGSAAGTAKLSSGASSSDDAYNGAFVKLTSSTHLLKNQVRGVADYVGSTRVATLTSNWTATNATGTVGVSNANTTVTGNGTAFSTELAVGDTIVIGGVTKIIDTITSDTVLDVTVAYGGNQVSQILSVTAPGQVGFNLYNHPFVGWIYDESADTFAFVSTLSDPGAAAVLIEDYLPIRVSKVIAPLFDAGSGVMEFHSSGNNFEFNMGLGGGAAKVTFTHNHSEVAYIKSDGAAAFFSLALGGSTAITSIDIDMAGGVSGSDDTLASAKTTKAYIDAQVSDLQGQIDGLGSPSLAIDDLTDVVITSGTTGDFLQFDGSDWINTASPVMAASAEKLVAGYTAASSNAAANNKLFVLVDEGGTIHARLPNPSSGGSFALAQINGVWRTGAKAVLNDHCEALLVEDNVSVAINDALYASTNQKGRVTIAGGTGAPGNAEFLTFVGYAKNVVTGGTNQLVKADLHIQPPQQV